MKRADLLEKIINSLQSGAYLGIYKVDREDSVSLKINLDKRVNLNMNEDGSAVLVAVFAPQEFPYKYEDILSLTDEERARKYEEDCVKWQEQIDLLQEKINAGPNGGSAYNKGILLPPGAKKVCVQLVKENNGCAGDEPEEEPEQKETFLERMKRYNKERKAAKAAAKEQ